MTENLKTIDEKTAESLFQRIAVWAGFDRCQIKVVSLPNNGIFKFELYFMDVDNRITSFLFKENAKTSKAEEIYVKISFLSKIPFKMFLSEILRCSNDEWHIKFIKHRNREMLLPALSTVESLLMLYSMSSQSHHLQLARTFQPNIPSMLAFHGCIQLPFH